MPACETLPTLAPSRTSGAIDRLEAWVATAAAAPVMSTTFPLRRHPLGL